MEQQADMKYLKLLAHEYQTIAEVSTEIINMKAILGLPKGTEHSSATFTASMSRSSTC